MISKSSTGPTPICWWILQWRKGCDNPVWNVLSRTGTPPHIVVHGNTHRRAACSLSNCWDKSWFELNASWPNIHLHPQQPMREGQWLGGVGKFESRMNVLSSQAQVAPIDHLKFHKIKLNVNDSYELDGSLPNFPRIRNRVVSSVNLPKWMVESGWNPIRTSTLEMKLRKRIRTLSHIYILSFSTFDSESNGTEHKKI